MGRLDDLLFGRIKEFSKWEQILKGTFVKSRIKIQGGKGQSRNTRKTNE